MSEKQANVDWDRTLELAEEGLYMAALQKAMPAIEQVRGAQSTGIQCLIDSQFLYEDPPLEERATVIGNTLSILASAAAASNQTEYAARLLDLFEEFMHNTSAAHTRERSCPSSPDKNDSPAETAEEE